MNLNQIQLLYTGHVTNGVLRIPNIKQLDIDLQLFEGEDVDLKITKKRVKRSLLSNAYYWAGIIPVVQQGLKDLGYRLTKEQVHEFLKDRFNRIDLVNDDGEFLNTVGSTANLTKEQFSDYIDKIIQFSAETLNVVIPPPKQQMQIV